MASWQQDTQVPENKNSFSIVLQTKNYIYIDTAVVVNIIKTQLCMH